MVDLLRVFGEPRTGQITGENIGQVRSENRSEVRSTHDATDMTNKYISHLENENKELKERQKEDTSFLQELVKEQAVKIADLEEELAEYISQ